MKAIPDCTYYGHLLLFSTPVKIGKMILRLSELPTSPPAIAVFRSHNDSVPGRILGIHGFRSSVTWYHLHVPVL